MASLAKWLSVRLRIKWLWVRVPLQSLITFFDALQSDVEKPGNIVFYEKPLYGVTGFEKM